MDRFKPLLLKMEAAPEGSTLLDADIAIALFPDKKVFLIGGRPHWIARVGGYRKETPIPAYSTSIDATLPWEEIVYVERLCGDAHFWRARQDPSYEADAATEALARRCAALKQKIMFQQTDQGQRDRYPYQEDEPRSHARIMDDFGDRPAGRYKRGRFTMQPDTPDANPEVIINILVDHIRELQEGHPAKAAPFYERREPANTQGFYLPIPLSNNPTTLPEAVAHDDGRSPLFSEIFRLWMEEKRPILKSRQRFETSARRFIEFAGDKPIADYTKTDLRLYFDAVWKLPKYTPNAMRRLPMPVIVNYFSVRPVRRVTTNTVKAHHKDLRAIFHWAHHFEYCRSNPAAGFRFVDKRLQSEKRVPFTESDLKRIFEESPVYRGCISSRRRKVPGNCIIKDSLFWMGLAGLYTGARLSELSRSVTDDYRFEEGIHYLDLHQRRDGPHIKTVSSDRQIPLHPELIRIGFLDWIQDRRDKGEPEVFKEMYGRRNVGAATGAWTQCWMAYQRDIGITDPRKVFHSFRHCFKRACRAAGIEEEVHDALTGHRPFYSSRRYGGPMPLQITYEAICKIKFNLDLSRLYVH